MNAGKKWMLTTTLTVLSSLSNGCAMLMAADAAAGLAVTAAKVPVAVGAAIIDFATADTEDKRALQCPVEQEEGN